MGLIDFEPTRIRVTLKSVSKQKTDSPKRENETVKPLSYNGYGVTQTLKTNKDLKTHTNSHFAPCQSQGG